MRLSLRTIPLSLILAGACAPAVQAAVIEVDCDPADLVLAFQTVEANSDTSNTLALDPGCTYTFATAQPAENAQVGATALPTVTRPQDLTINGNGATIERSTAGGTPDFRLLQFGLFGGAPPKGDFLVTINDLIVRNGHVVTAPGNFPLTYGGGVAFRGNPGDAFRMNGSQLIDNEADSGGGLSVAAFPGPIDVAIADSEFRGNRAFVSGAGLQLENSSGTVESSIVADNILNASGITPPSFGPDPERGEAGAAGLACYGCNPLTLSDLTITGNQAHGIGGGGVLIAGGQVRIERSRIESNSAVAFSHGPTVGSEGGRKGEGGDGGGLVAMEGFFQPANVDVVDSAILGNSASRRGGGIATAGENADPGTKSVIRIANTTVSGNTAGDAAGGIAIGGGEVSLINATVANNTARYAGGVGIGHYSYDGIMFSNPFTPLVTVGSARFINTVIAGNTGTDDTVVVDDCGVEQATETDGGGVLENVFSLLQIEAPAAPEDYRCSATFPFALTGDPLLGPLADNGGLDPSHLPLAGSPLIDAGSVAAIPLDFDFATDQRGFPRVMFGEIDIGSIEVFEPDIFEDGFEGD